MVGRALDRLRVVEVGVNEVIALLNLVLPSSPVLLNWHVLGDAPP